MFFEEFAYNTCVKTILFQGDSITDANRNRLLSKSLGDGFVSMVAKNWNKHYHFFNRGIAGHRSHDLVKRWNKDTLALKPDILFILVGINDIWHEFKFGLKSNQQEYERNMRALLDQTKQHVPHCQIVILYPFILKIGHYEPRWETRLVEQHHVLDQLKQEYSLNALNLHFVLEQASLKHDLKDLAPDGVHLGSVGNNVVAQAIEAYLETL
jgi:lysophospholipase L1-like esterase